MSNIDIAKKQVEFVKKKLRELDAQTGGECQGLIIADYTKEEFEKIRPDDDWSGYIEQRFLFTCMLQRENIAEKVIFQQIDFDGFSAYCAKNGLDNNEASRGLYAVQKYGKEHRKDEE